MAVCWTAYPTGPTVRPEAPVQEAPLGAVLQGP